MTSNDDHNSKQLVVVFDDRPLVRLGLRRSFDGTPLSVCGEAATTAELNELIDLHRPSLIIGEWSLNGESVIALVPGLRLSTPRTGVLFYSSSDNPLDEARSLKAGAHGYLCATKANSDLLSAAVRVAAGDVLWTGADRRRLASYLCDGRVTIGSFAPLTHRENEILQHVVLGETNREIATVLDISPETVKEHVQHILKKLGVSDRTQAAVWAVRNGIA